MSEDLDSISEEEQSLFRPFTRDSLAVIEARIADEHAKQKELEKKRAEGEVRIKLLLLHHKLKQHYLLCHFKKPCDMKSCKITK